jgi:hypothetical protein
MYHVYLYYQPKATQNIKSYINIAINGEKKKKCEREIYQNISYPSVDGDFWQEISGKRDEQGVWHRYPIELKYDDVLDISLDAGILMDQTENDTIIADAIWLQSVGTGVNKILTCEKPWFFTPEEMNRTYLGMVEDGGPAKTLFYLLQACSISDFVKPNNLGNLYAMGNNGLISFGTSTSNYTDSKFEPYIGKIRMNKCFGEAAKEHIQEHFPKNNYKLIFSLLGAGTLKPKAYIPYKDYNNLSLSNTTITDPYEDLSVAQDVSFTNVTLPADKTLKILSGRDIIINPYFLADYGSKLDLSVDPNLDK